MLVDHQPTCTCPDFLNRGGPCKHMLFVTLRVLGNPSTSLHIVQRALLTDELRQVLGRGSNAADTLASDAVRRAWQGVATGPAEQQEAPARGVEEGSECAICFEPLTAERSRACASCRNGLHTDCLQRLAAHSASSGVRCPYCRGAFEAGSVQTRGGYVNLAGVSPGHRDVQLADLYGERARWIIMNGGGLD